MKTKLYKNIIRLTALLVVLSLFPSGLGLAIADRPEAAVPFEGELTTVEGSQITLFFDTVMALTSVNVFQTGADRLATIQNNDGGWDWTVADDGNPANISPKNTVGPIGQGLALAFDYTGDPDHMAALADAGNLLLGKQYNFSPSDGYLAFTLDEIFGGTTYTDHVVANFYNPLAAGTYNRNGTGTLYGTATYVNLIRTSRSGIQANMAAWDIGMGLVGAAMAGADTAPWIAGLKAEIDELNSSAYYDVIGLAGAIYGLAFVGEDFDPTAGSHAAASSLADLGLILADYQLATGGFTWNSVYQGEGEDNETTQETAYAILALEKLSRSLYLGAVQSAADYLESVQLANGGWKDWAGGGENNEITGEALWGIYAAYPYNQPPIAEANGPYMVAVGQSVALDHTGSSDPDGDALAYNWAVTGPALGTVAMETFTAGTVAGITEVTLTVDDGFGGTATDTAMVVVYDPNGGFVTGGGWIDSPAGALAPALVWNQGFETDASGWDDSTTSWYGSITQVPSGTNGITSSDGSGHAVLEGDADSGPSSRFDGYRSVWPGTWTAEVDVYLDPAWASGTGFDYSVAATGSDGLHQRDFIFHVTKDTSTGMLIVAGSNNTNFAPRQDLENINHYNVTGAGWYTFQHVFRDQGGALAVDLNLLDSSGNLLFTETRFNAVDLIPAEVGGNRYGWFTFINVAGGIAVDEHQLYMPVNTTGRATFGFVSKYRRGATVPDGNTEFQFKAGNLNFSSTSYQWLVVNQAGTNAQFKGTGTINGAGNYGFMLWATDGSPDTFRIQIWDVATEVVVYDNGSAQPIGGGSIVVRKR